MPPHPKTGAETMAPHADPTRFDNGFTLTNERTDGLTDDLQDQGSNRLVPDTPTPVENGVVRLSDALDEWAQMLATTTERMPVLNHEPRLVIGESLRHGLWKREQGLCWICGGSVVRPVADHVRPRSNWPTDQLHLADRSDNLRLACWVCNEKKSNFYFPGGEKPLGITSWCSRCQLKLTGSEFESDAPVRCFCNWCGLGGIAESADLYLAAEAAAS